MSAVSSWFQPQTKLNPLNRNQLCRSCKEKDNDYSSVWCHWLSANLHKSIQQVPRKNTTIHLSIHVECHSSLFIISDGWIKNLHIYVEAEEQSYNESMHSTRQHKASLPAARVWYHINPSSMDYSPKKHYYKRSSLKVGYCLFSELLLKEAVSPLLSLSEDDKELTLSLL